MPMMVETVWPPRSAHEALLSSPSGRRKYKEMVDRRERSLSPTKRPAATPKQATSASFEDADMEEDDDEETLQLKLAAIEARLKLKKLQKAKAESSSFDSDLEEARSRPFSAGALSASRPSSRIMEDRERPRFARTESSIQVPLSPTRRPAPTLEPKSPSRILLGIDKGLKGRDVSLRKPPSARERERETPRRDIFTNAREGMSSRSSFHSVTPRPGSSAQLSSVRPKSFSERIAESRSTDRERREKAERRDINRSTSFGLDKEEMEHFQSEASRTGGARSPVKKRPEEAYSREDVLRAYGTPGAGGLLRRKDSASNGALLSNDDSRPPSSNSTRENRQTADADSSGADPSKYESYSSLHLSSRILPHSFLKRKFDSKTVFLIPDLLKIIKGPNFEAPDVDGDYVVFGVIASKSPPKDHKDPKRAERISADETGKNNDSKYMVLCLTDLHWTIDLFLFSTAFSRYYKLAPGTVVAILNPPIMPPPPNKKDTNKFSLTLSSDEDTVLEIGTARDLGFCKAVRKDGKTCDSWIDSRKTEFCDFHVDVQIQKTKSSRMEVNTGSTMFAPGGRSGSRTGMFGVSRGRGNGGDRDNANSRSSRFKDNGLKPDTSAGVYDRATGSRYFVAPAPGGSNNRSNIGSGPHHFTSRAAASLIDDDNDDPFIAAGNMPRGESREERLRKRLAAQQKERDIAKKLGATVGGGMGAEYLKSREFENTTAGSTPASKLRMRANAGSFSSVTTPSLTSTASTAATTASVSSFGFGTRKASTVSLSPVKKRVFHDSEDDNLINNDATGRGSTSSNGRGVERTPLHSVKKTRFVTAKGIREAGRDSLGGASILTARAADEDEDGDNATADNGGGERRRIGNNDNDDADDDDDDDDLDII